MVEFIDDAFEVAIKKGNVILTWPGGRSRAMPIATFQEEVRRGSEALAKWQVAELDKVVSFPRR